MMLRRRLQAAPRPRPGFTLVEILIAAVVMVFSTIGSAVLFNQATRQGISSNRHLGEQLAISRDLAALLDLNERYNCGESGCGVNSALPDQDEYAPAEIGSAQGSDFRALCNQGLLNDLFASHIGTQTLPGTTVQRTVHLLDAVEVTGGQQSISPHRYRVDWRADSGNGRLLRQVQLIPTVAAWCP